MHSSVGTHRLGTQPKGSVTPVIQRASSEAKNATAAATSPARPTSSGCDSRSLLTAWGDNCSLYLADMFVSTTPGATATTRMPHGANSQASDWVKPFRPALEAL